MTETASSRTTTVPATMRAVIQERYGAPELVLTAGEVPVPGLGADDVLLRVAASAVNALDWHYTTGEPMFARLALGLRRPKRRTPGNDVSGTVLAVGSSVDRFQAGDEVFGVDERGGCFAEYVVAPADWFVARPQGLPLDEAAAIGTAALTALQGLRDWGGLKEGQSVLVNGASGGVGTYAVQIAKALGAGHVTAVCSTRNLEQARALGADAVVDYTREEIAGAFDLFLDNAGSTTIRRAKQLLTEHGTYVMITAPKSRWLHPLPRMLATPLAYVGSDKQGVAGKVAKRSTADLEQLRVWVEEGKVRPAVEARLPLAEGPEVVRVQGEFHARGKTLVIP